MSDASGAGSERIQPILQCTRSRLGTQHPHTSHPLVSMPDMICTPHIGYVTREEWDLQFSDVFDQVNRFAAGTPVNVVNPEVLERARPGDGPP